MGIVDSSTESPRSRRARAPKSVRAAVRAGTCGAMDNRLLGIYLNDQLAAGVLWREIARRAQRNNDGSELGEALARVAQAIAEDVETFERIMRRLGVRRNPLKTGLALAAERGGRLKLNGRLRSYSPLSRFSELDFLAYGIEGKKVLWQNLRDCARLGERLPDVDFDELISRAQRQRDEIEPFRLAAGNAAFRQTADAANARSASVGAGA
jgi:hypothetical protein